MVDAMTPKTAGDTQHKNLIKQRERPLWRRLGRGLLFMLIGLIPLGLMTSLLGGLGALLGLFAMIGFFAQGFNGEPLFGGTNVVAPVGAPAAIVAAAAGPTATVAPLQERPTRRDLWWKIPVSVIGGYVVIVLAAASFGPPHAPATDVSTADAVEAVRQRTAQLEPEPVQSAESEAKTMAASASQSDDCQGTVQLSLMLSQLDGNTCKSHQLSVAGRELFAGVLRKSFSIGGFKCAAAAKTAWLQDLRFYNSDLERIAASGDQAALDQGICAATVKYFGVLAQGSQQAPLFEARTKEVRTAVADGVAADLTKQGMAMFQAAPLSTASPSTQLHPPASCSATNSKCIRLWFDEYRASLLNEFAQYRGLEGEVVTAFKSPNRLAEATRLQGTISSGGWYRHQWRKATPEQAQAAGLEADMERLDICRIAIVQMKYHTVLLGLDQLTKEKVNADFAEYLGSALQCEKSFPALQPAPHSAARAGLPVAQKRPAP
jgi:hypothetical protein